MTTNPYFRTFSGTNEQDLLSGLIAESIDIYGEDMYYLPKKWGNVDPVLQQSNINYFNVALLLSIYIESIEGFAGEQSIMSKFGFEIRDRVTFLISRQTFDTTIGIEYQIPRPLEGDLIYFPLNNKCFEIMFVEDKPTFYPLGILPQYRVQCQLFEYSNEIFNTGIAEIDALQTEFSADLLQHTLTTESGLYLLTEDGTNILIEWSPSSQDINRNNTNIEQQANNIIDPNATTDPFADVIFKPIAM